MEATTNVHFQKFLQNIWGILAVCPRPLEPVSVWGQAEAV